MQTSEDQKARGPEQERQVRLHAPDVDLDYANITVVASTPEEVVLNFGFNAGPNEEGEVHIQVSNRVILSYPSAKRLAITLGNLVKRYEDARGVIELPERQQAPSTGPSPGQAGT